MLQVFFFWILFNHRVGGDSVTYVSIDNGISNSETAWQRFDCYAVQSGFSCAGLTLHGNNSLTFTRDDWPCSGGICSNNGSYFTVTTTLSGVVTPSSGYVAAKGFGVWTFSVAGTAPQELVDFAVGCLGPGVGYTGEVYAWGNLTAGVLGQGDVEVLCPATGWMRGMPALTGVQVTRRTPLSYRILGVLGEGGGVNVKRVDTWTYDGRTSVTVVFTGPPGNCTGVVFGTPGRTSDVGWGDTDDGRLFYALYDWDPGERVISGEICCGSCAPFLFKGDPTECGCEGQGFECLKCENQTAYVALICMIALSGLLFLKLLHKVWVSDFLRLKTLMNYVGVRVFALFLLFATMCIRKKVRNRISKRLDGGKRIPCIQAFAMIGLVMAASLPQVNSQTGCSVGEIATVNSALTDVMGTAVVGQTLSSDTLSGCVTNQAGLMSCSAQISTTFELSGLRGAVYRYAATSSVFPSSGGAASPISPSEFGFVDLGVTVEHKFAYTYTFADAEVWLGTNIEYSALPPFGQGPITPFDAACQWGTDPYAGAACYAGHRGAWTFTDPNLASGVHSEWISKDPFAGNGPPATLAANGGASNNPPLMFRNPHTPNDCSAENIVGQQGTGWPPSFWSVSNTKSPYSDCSTFPYPTGQGQVCFSPVSWDQANFSHLFAPQAVKAAPLSRFAFYTMSGGVPSFQCYGVQAGDTGNRSPGPGIRFSAVPGWDASSQLSYPKDPVIVTPPVGGHEIGGFNIFSGPANELGIYDATKPGGLQYLGIPEPCTLSYPKSFVVPPCGGGVSGGMCSVNIFNSLSLLSDAYVDVLEGYSTTASLANITLRFSQTNTTVQEPYCFLPPSDPSLTEVGCPECICASSRTDYVYLGSSSGSEPLSEGVLGKGGTRNVTAVTSVPSLIITEVVRPIGLILEFSTITPVSQLSAVITPQLAGPYSVNGTLSNSGAVSVCFIASSTTGQGFIPVDISGDITGVANSQVKLTLAAKQVCVPGAASSPSGSAQVCVYGTTTKVCSATFTFNVTLRDNAGSMSAYQSIASTGLAAAVMDSNRGHDGSSQSGFGALTKGLGSLGGEIANAFGPVGGGFIALILMFILYLAPVIIVILIFRSLRARKKKAQ